MEHLRDLTPVKALTVSRTTQRIVPSRTLLASLSNYETPLRTSGGVGVLCTGSLVVNVRRGVVRDCHHVGSVAMIRVTLHTTAQPTHVASARRKMRDVVRETPFVCIGPSGEVEWDISLDFTNCIFRENVWFSAELLVAKTEADSKQALLLFKSKVLVGPEEGDVMHVVPDDTTNHKVILETSCSNDPTRLGSLRLQFAPFADGFEPWHAHGHMLGDIYRPNETKSVQGHATLVRGNSYRIRVTHADVMRIIDLPRRRQPTAPVVGFGRKGLTLTVGAGGAKSGHPKTGELLPNTEATWGETLEIDNASQPVYITVVSGDRKAPHRQIPVGDAIVHIEEINLPGGDRERWKVNLTKPGKAWAHIMLRDYECQHMAAQVCRCSAVVSVEKMLEGILAVRTKAQKDTRAPGKMVDDVRALARDVRERIKAWNVATQASVRLLESLLLHVKSLGDVSSNDEAMAELHEKLLDSIPLWNNRKPDLTVAARDFVFQCLAAMQASPELPLDVSRSPNLSMVLAIDAAFENCRTALRRRPFPKAEPTLCGPAALFGGLFSTLRPLAELHVVNSTITQGASLSQHLDPLFCSLEQYCSTGYMPTCIVPRVTPSVAAGEIMHIKFFIMRHAQYVLDYEMGVATVEVIANDSDSKADLVIMKSFVDVKFGSGCENWHPTKSGRFTMRLSYKGMCEVFPIVVEPGPLHWARIDCAKSVQEGSECPLSVFFEDRFGNLCEVDLPSIKICTEDSTIEISGSVEKGCLKTTVQFPLTVPFPFTVSLRCEIIFPEGMSILTLCNPIRVLPPCTALKVDICDVPSPYYTLEDVCVRVRPITDNGDPAYLPAGTLISIQAAVGEAFFPCATTSILAQDGNAYCFCVVGHDPGMIAIHATAGQSNLIRGSVGPLSFGPPRARMLRFEKSPKVVDGVSVEAVVIHAVDGNGNVDKAYNDLVMFEAYNTAVPEHKPIEVTLVNGVGKIPKFEVCVLDDKQWWVEACDPTSQSKSGWTHQPSSSFTFRARSATGKLAECVSSHVSVNGSPELLSLAWKEFSTDESNFKGIVYVSKTSKDAPTPRLKYSLITAAGQLLPLDVPPVDTKASSIPVSFSLPSACRGKTTYVMATAEGYVTAIAPVVGTNLILCAADVGIRSVQEPLPMMKPKCVSTFTPSSYVDEEVDIVLEVRDPFVPPNRELAVALFVGTPGQWDCVTHRFVVKNFSAFTCRVLQEKCGEFTILCVVTASSDRSYEFTLGTLTRKVKNATSFDFEYLEVPVEGCPLHVQLQLFDEAKNACEKHHNSVAVVQLIFHGGTTPYAVSHVVTKVERSKIYAVLPTAVFGPHSLRVQSSFLVHESTRIFFVRPYRGIVEKECKYGFLALHALTTLHHANACQRALNEFYPEHMGDVTSGGAADKLLTAAQPNWVTIQSLAEMCQRYLKACSGSHPDIPKTTHWALNHKQCWGKCSPLLSKFRRDIDEPPHMPPRAPSEIIISVKWRPNTTLEVPAEPRRRHR